MTPPFPAVHAQANEDARDRAASARALLEQAGGFLEQLDELLAPADPR